MSKINYENKEAWQDDATIPDKNKVTSANMNEIKRVINENDDKFNNYYPSNDIDSKLEAQKNMINNLEKKHNNDISTVNNNINNIKTEQTTQNKNIKTNTDKNTAQDIEIEKLKSNLIKLQAEGEEIQVNDSSDLEAKIDILGNTKQETTEGKNLIDVEDWFKTCDIPYTKKGNIYHITDVHNAYYNPYTLKFPTDLSVSMQGIIKGITATNVSIDVHPVGSDRFYGWIKEGQTTHENVKIDQIRIYYVSNGTCDLSNFQIEEGAKVTQYEPYTGGQASPNPDYPQEIESVKSYNLYPISNLEIPLNYGFIEKDINMEANQKYTFSFKKIISSANKTKFLVIFKNDTKSKEVFYDNVLSHTITLDFIATKVRFYSAENYSAGVKVSAKYEGIMLNKGEQKPYQPYGEIAVKQTGKNLLNPNTDVKNGYWTNTPDNFQVGAIWYSFYKYLRKGTYTISVIPQQVDKDVVNKFERFWIDGIETLYSTDVNQTTTITLKENGLFACNIVAKGKDYTKQPYIQLEEGTEPTPYEPYKEIIYPIKLGENEMNKIGNAQDYFHRINGKWHLHKEIGKYVFTGNENWIEDNKYPNSYTFYTTDIKLGTKQSFGYNIYCNHFRAINLTNVNSITGTIYATYIAIDEKIVQTVDQFKQWLKNNPTYALYELKEPTETEITDPVLISQLNALENAKLFKPTTRLTNNSIAIMKLDYIADTKAYIDNKLSQIAIANEKPKEQIMQNTPQTIPERLENKKVTE